LVVPELINSHLVVLDAQLGDGKDVVIRTVVAAILVVALKSYHRATTKAEEPALVTA
jgi:hypothetical protein